MHCNICREDIFARDNYLLYFKRNGPLVEVTPFHEKCVEIKRKQKDDDKEPIKSTDKNTKEE